MMKKLRIILLLLTLALSGITADRVSASLPADIGIMASNTAGVSYFNQAPQEVSITIAASSASNTATITTVGANAFLIYQGFSYNTIGTNLGDKEFATIALTNATTVTATRQTGTAGAGAVTINAVVIDPTSNLVTGVQQGTITFSAATSATTTITSVNTALSSVFFLGGRSTGTSITTDDYGVTITNATTVTGTANASSTGTAEFVVVTWNTNVIQSMQQFSLTSTTSSTTDTQTITSVTAANSFIAYGGFNTADINGAYNKALTWGTITNATTVTYTRSAATTSTRTNFFTVVEFKSGILNQSVQRGSIVLASVASNTATVTSVNTAKSFCNFTGFLSNSTANSADDQVYHKITQTSATVETGTRNTAGTVSGTIGYEVVEFK